VITLRIDWQEPTKLGLIACYTGAMQQAPLKYTDAPWTFRLIGVNIVIHALAALDSSGIITGYGVLDVAAVLLADQWWRLLSATFLHGNVMHLLFNCVGLLIFGSMLERLLSANRYLLVYLCGGVAANALVVAYKLLEGQQYYSVGSSGAIMAVIGATAVIAVRMWQMQRTRVWVILFQRMAVIVSLQILIDLLVPINSMLTHLAGLGCGALMGLAILSMPRRA